MWDQVGQLYAYHEDVPAEVRLLKLTEEVGEVADAFIGMHGLNRRKGVCRTRDDLLAELATSAQEARREHHQISKPRNMEQHHVSHGEPRRARSACAARCWRALLTRRRARTRSRCGRGRRGCAGGRTPRASMLEGRGRCRSPRGSLGQRPPRCSRPARGALRAKRAGSAIPVYPLAGTRVTVRLPGWPASRVPVVCASRSCLADVLFSVWPGGGVMGSSSSFARPVPGLAAPEQAGGASDCFRPGAAPVAGTCAGRQSGDSLWPAGVGGRGAGPLSG